MTGRPIERSGPNDAVARVTLARPEVHNAFNATLIAELRQVFAALAREGPTELRAVVLAGDGPTFCAGADIDWMRAAMQLDVEAQRAGRDGDGRHARGDRHLSRAGDRSRPGRRLGGGAGLCAVADLVIAEAGAKFGFTETRLGILPAVISPFVIARIGETHARALFPGGRRFDAIRAQRIGLVHEVVEGLEALDAAVAHGRRRHPRLGPDRGPGGEGDHPRGARRSATARRNGTRPGSSPASASRRGPGGLPRVRREAPAGAGHRIRSDRRARLRA